MRAVGLTLVFSVIAVGTVALAEPAGVIDPWGRTSGDADSWFGSSSDDSPPDERARVIQAELKDPWAPASEAPAPFAAERTIDVFPIERAAQSGARSDDGIVNPWAPPMVAQDIPSLAAATQGDVSHRTRTPWSEHFVEIVDPWKRMPEWAAADRVRLVVDPWAR